MEQDADLAVCRYRKIYENRRVDLSTPMAAVFEGQELLAKYLEEDEAWLIQTAVWNKLWKRSLSDGLRFPKSLYEDMYFTIRLLAKSKRSVYLDWAMYNYVCSRATSTTNIGLNEKTFNDLIPNFYERSAFFFRSVGRIWHFCRIIFYIKDCCYSIRRSAEARIQRKKNIRHFCSRK